MIKEYCEKNNYDIVDVYNDAGHSGKDLMKPEMQRMLKDIKSHKLDKIIAIKVDRLTRNNYDGFWLLNYCEQHDVKIELILEPYDVSTANGEMFYGINLVFGQCERKEIGARTKRAMEEMALEHIHPSKAPYGYVRNKDTGKLEVDPIESQVVKEIFDYVKENKKLNKSLNEIRTLMPMMNNYKNIIERFYEALSIFNKAFKDIDLISASKTSTINSVSKTVEVVFEAVNSWIKLITLLTTKVLLHDDYTYKKIVEDLHKFNVLNDKEFNHIFYGNSLNYNLRNNENKVKIER